MWQGYPRKSREKCRDFVGIPGDTQGMVIRIMVNKDHNYHGNGNEKADHDCNNDHICNNDINCNNDNNGDGGNKVNNGK